MIGAKKQNFITLKEAAEISGYSPDYLGQLIRNGKIEGQQVFLNTAWMTTKEDVESYIEKSKGKKKNEDTTFIEMVQEYWKGHWRDFSVAGLYVVIGLNVLFIFFLFHLLSFSIEKHFEQKDIASSYSAQQIMYVQK